MIDATLCIVLIISFKAFLPLANPQDSGSLIRHYQVERINQGDATGEYTVVLSSRIAKDNDRLVLLISIPAESFDRDRMVKLALKLNSDFKDEKRLEAILFDSETAARNYNPAGGSFDVAMKLERGHYVLDRTKQREYIYFSSKRGQPVNEVKISLSERTKLKEQRRQRNQL